MPFSQIVGGCGHKRLQEMGIIGACMRSAVGTRRVKVWRKTLTTLHESCLAQTAFEKLEEVF